MTIPSSAQLIREWDIHQAEDDPLLYHIENTVSDVGDQFVSNGTQLVYIYTDALVKRLRDRLRYRRALERILELAERSDAHPELPIAAIAREALGK